MRKTLENRRKDILEMAWKSGSGIGKGREQGIFFCAKVGDRTYLRFVHADNNWQPSYVDIQTENQITRKLKIEIELGRCLRLIECLRILKLYYLIHQKMQLMIYGCLLEIIFMILDVRNRPINLNQEYVL